MAEHSKGDKTVEQSKKDLEKARKQKEVEVAEKLEHDAANKVDEEKNAELVSTIQNKFSDVSAATKKKVKAFMAEHDIPNFKNADEIPTANLEAIVAMLNEDE